METLSATSYLLMNIFKESICSLILYSKYFLSPGISPEDFSLRKSLSIGGFIYSVQIFTLTIKKKQTKTLFQALFLSSLSE